MKKWLLVFLLVLPLTGCVDVVKVQTTTRNVTAVNKIDSELEEQINTIAAFYDKATLCVLNYQYETPTTASSLGSGVVYKKIDNHNNTYTYYLVTNRHVVDGGEKFSVYNGESTISADLLGVSSTYDIAVLTFTNSIELNVVPFADYEELSKGDMVFAMGTPLDTSYYNTFTGGYISGFRDFYIQHDVSINAGNSGGPLFNLSGELIGINTSKLSNNGSSDVSIDGIGFSIACPYVESSVAIIEANNELIVRPVLGVSTRDVSVINEFNYPTFADYYTFKENEYVEAYLEAYPTTNEETIRASFKAMNEATLLSNYNLVHPYCQYIPAGVTEGVLVADVVPNNPAAIGGIEKYDIITHVGETAITDATKLKEAIYAVGANNSVTFTINRNGAILTKQINL